MSVSVIKDWQHIDVVYRSGCIQRKGLYMDMGRER